MHYSKPIPKKLAAILKKEVGIGGKEKQLTYGEVFDGFAEKYGIHFVLEPFTTFAFECRTGFVWKFSRYDDTLGKHRTVSEESEYEGGGFGGSWELTAGDAIIRAIKFVKENK